MSDPKLVVVAGDWHGNTQWAVHIIHEAGKLTRGEQRGNKIILHAGDFGIWPNGHDYLDAVNKALAEEDLELWFVDGNHEDFSQLQIDPDWPTDCKVVIGDRRTSRACWLPRGHRWSWHGRRWLALGGAVSVDKAMRVEGYSWWPEEEITDAQARRVIEGGHADVMLSHDCPSGPIFTFPPPPPQWDSRDLARSEVHRERLRYVVDAVMPLHIIHGHYHQARQRRFDFGYGDVEITGLSYDGQQHNYALLDVETMEWTA